MFYAELNSDSICTGISNLSDEVTDANMISIDSYDVSLMGKRWTGSSWEEVEVEPEPIDDDVDETQMMYLEAFADICERLETIEANQIDIMMAQADIYESSLEGGEE